MGKYESRNKPKDIRESDDTYDSYVLKCMKCGNTRYINKGNNIIKIFKKGCIECKTNRWELLGEGNFITTSLNIPKKDEEDTDAFVLEHIAKSGVDNLTYDRGYPTGENYNTKKVSHIEQR